MSRLRKKLGTDLVYSPGNQWVCLTRNRNVTLEKILIPVTEKPRPDRSIELAQQLICDLGLKQGRITLLHAGSAETFPDMDLPAIEGWEFVQHIVEGNPADAILETIESLGADLVIMTTDGPDRFLDGIFGTTSERVLRKATCPVAFVPLYL